MNRRGGDKMENNRNMPNLPSFPTGKDDELKGQMNCLNITEKFKEEFDLRTFLIESVLGRNFESEQNGVTITIKNNDDFLKTIITYLKAKKYIGVGVGGVYIKDKITGARDNEEYVLLYKRYHEPENQRWSILGGSSKMHENIEDTLVQKTCRITNVSKDSVVVKDIIKANNHDEQDFHFLSPAFYMDILNPSAYLYWGAQKNKYGRKREVKIIKGLDDFSVIGHSTYEEPLLAWVPVKMINGELTDEDGEPIFSFTTVQAIKCHCHIREATLGLEAATQQVVKVTEKIKAYQDWRTIGT
jgi:ADP-ribose pyrophosphatase YjhB (NUDIX family)